MLIIPWVNRLLESINWKNKRKEKWLKASKNPLLKTPKKVEWIINPYSIKDISETEIQFNNKNLLTPVSITIDNERFYWIISKIDCKWIYIKSSNIFNPEKQFWLEFALDWFLNKIKWKPRKINEQTDDNWNYDYYVEFNDSIEKINNLKVFLWNYKLSLDKV